MTQWDLLYILLAAGVIWTVVWLSIILSASRVRPEAEVDASTAKWRKRLVYPIGVVLVVGLAASLYSMPYPSVRSRTLGEGQVAVNVSSLQWGWIMSQDEVHVNQRIEFSLTTRDVNHDFAIYDPDGRLITQAQVMPGYTNKLIWEFHKTGTYTVRCLEYCGLGHHGMITTFRVV